MYNVHKKIYFQLENIYDLNECKLKFDDDTIINHTHYS